MAVISNRKKFRILFWKNFKLQWHKKWQMALDILIPCLMVFMLLFLRWAVLPTSSDGHKYKTLPLDDLRVLKYYLADQGKRSIIMNLFRGILPGIIGLRFELIYAPQNPFLENIMRETADILDLDYSSVNTLSELTKELESDNYLAGVAFDESYASLTDYPKSLSFTLRFPKALRTNPITDYVFTWETNSILPFLDDTGPRNAGFEDGGIPSGYYQEGFLPIQNVITMTYIKLASGQSQLDPSMIQFRRFPDPPYVSDTLIGVVNEFMPMFIMLSFMQLSMAMVKQIALEKEKQLKEVMKVLGLNNWLHWAAWFVKSFIVFAAVSLLITLLLWIKFTNDVAVLTNSDPTAVYVLLLVFSITCICASFMFSVFFSKAGTASATLIIFFFITYFPYSFLTHHYHQLSFTEKMLWSLLSNTAMGFSVHVILMFEAKGEGLQWHNFFEPASFEDELTVGYMVLMMLGASILYMLICLYVEQVIPGEFGVAQPWYFPFTLKFWVKKEDNDSTADLEYYANSGKRDPKFFEHDPSGKELSVEAFGLQKKFNKIYAVEDFTLNMYADEITVLIGHSGAGKTTTIGMLSGMCAPSGGSAYINGYHIVDDVDEARQSMGIVLQHNVLFDELTVAEHIKFFSMVKGYEGADLDDEVNYYLEKIDLTKKRNVLASRLSGGMKRKLQLCCALCGNTKIVLLDEPSAGMDPLARRQMWELLQKEKVGRTILITSQLMDEAEVLGDRITIMTSGKTVAYGSAFFLKTGFSDGYLLVCVKEEKCDTEKLTKFLSGYIEGISPVSENDTEIRYRLPSNLTKNFGEIFERLEQQSVDMKVKSFGIRGPSLDDVFLKLGNEEVGNQLPQGEKRNSFSLKVSQISKLKLILNRWHAMLIKKSLYSLRRWVLLLVQLMLPIYFVLVSILVSRQSDFGPDTDSMTISLKQYPSAEILMELKANANPLFENVAQNYREIVQTTGSSYKIVETDGEEILDFILNAAKSEKMNDKYLAGASFRSTRIIAWLNNNPLHTAPLTLNLVHNAIARELLGKDAKITITNHPITGASGVQLMRLQEGKYLGALLAINLSLCFGFTVAFFIMFLVTERQTRSKLLQFVSGVGFWTFWISHLLWDLFIYLLIALTALIVLIAFQVDCCNTFPNIMLVLSFMLLFGVCALIFVYVFSFLFSDPATAFLYTSAIGVLFGVLPYLICFMLSAESPDIVNLVKNIFHPVPHFSLAYGLQNLNMNILTHKLCSSDEAMAIPEPMRCDAFPDCCELKEYWHWNAPGAMQEVFYLLLIGIIFLILLIIIDYGLINMLMQFLRNRKVKPPAPIPEHKIDSDVLAEARAIENMNQKERENQLVLLDHVTKYYGKFLAVNQVSVYIRRKECFGLMGINGAGKTSTFKMMIGDEAISYGDAYMGGINLRTNRNKVIKNYGYCPQFDALLGLLTARETMKIFSLLRGVRNDRIEHDTVELCIALGFVAHLDKKIDHFSGGNKRKLSTAIALIGNPDIVFLDEPTSAMDPLARMHIFDCLEFLRDNGKSLVLTSHDLNECEALCTRMVIMVNGVFKCMGSVQHLKNKFSKGLTIKIKVLKDPTDSLYSEDSNISKTENGPGYESSTELSIYARIKNFISVNLPKAVLQFVYKLRHTTNVLQSGTKKQNNATIENEKISDQFKKLEVIKKFMAQKLAKAKLQEEQQGFLTYYVSSESTTLSALFSLMEAHRKELHIEDYTIDQTRLEEIFLDFAREQREENIDTSTAQN